MNFINRHRRKFFLGAAILLIVSIIVTGTNIYNPRFLKSVTGFIVEPAQKAVSTAISSVQGALAGRRSIEELTKENARLLEQIAVLTDENKRLSLFEIDNIELSKLLDINRKYPDYEKMGVQITSSDTSNWYSVFTIDRGYNDGIAEDMFVVAEGGLAGRIFDVSARYSKLMALTDDRSAVHGQSRQTDDAGVVKGDTYLMQQGLLVMDYIDLDADISANDEILTSAYSEIYPAGITIGYVKEIKPSDDGLTKSAIIVPGVDFDRLSKGTVLLKKIE
jgi:rod shape-determining protein MreC